MSSREFAEWMAYEQVAGPLGPERFDVLFALLSTVVYNSAGPKKAKKPKDFLAQWDQRPQSAEEMLTVVKALTAAFGGETKEAE